MRKRPQRTYCRRHRRWHTLAEAIHCLRGQSENRRTDRVARRKDR